MQKEKQKEFRFWKTYCIRLFILVSTSVILGLFFGGFKENINIKLFWIVFISALLSVLLSFIARGAYQTKKVHIDDIEQYKGLGGWLIVIGIGLIISIINVVGYLSASVNHYDKVFLGLVLLFLTSLTIFYFKRKKIFKHFFIIFLLINIFLSLAGESGEEVAINFAFAFLNLIIWSLYILKSKRVRATFVENIIK